MYERRNKIFSIPSVTHAKGPDADVTDKMFLAFMDSQGKAEAGFTEFKNSGFYPNGALFSAELEV